jgi:hypothetical protein
VDARYKAGHDESEFIAPDYEMTRRKCAKGVDAAAPGIRPAVFADCEA